jgi:tetratricopeptide (TPR) repeat protein
VRSIQLQLAALGFAVATAASTAALAAGTPWTPHDLDTVADAAVAAAETMKDHRSAHANMLAQLAETLAKSGAKARAVNVLLKAGTVLDPPNDFAASEARAHVLGDLAKFGDEHDAAALANVDSPVSVKAGLLGALGTGQAQAGNIAGALQTAETIASLGPSSDPAFSTVSAASLKKIAMAFVDAGALDHAMHVADGLSDKAAATEIIARLATALCRSGKGDKGQKLAVRAAADASDVAASASAPAMYFYPVIDTAEALTACAGLDSAASFFRDAVPPKAVDATRTALIDALARNDQAALAVAVSPSPQPGDANGFFNLAKRMVRKGDTAGAIKAAVEASRILQSTNYPASSRELVERDVALGHAIDFLNEVGAYDAAMAAAQAIPLNRNAFYVKTVETAIANKDSANVRRLLPVVIKELNVPDPSGKLSTLFLGDLAKQLAHAGYRDQAQPIYEQLSDLVARGAMFDPKNRVPAVQFAELRAAMGDLSGALQVAGTDANVLAHVAMEMAGRGDIAGAQKAEAELDAAPPEIVVGDRDGALAFIASAQVKAGDMQGALATVRRISEDLPRWNNLLKLAEVAPSQ